MHYEYDAQNVEVPKETRWDLFIALMVLIALLGAVFLLLLEHVGQAPAEPRGRGAQAKVLQLREGVHIRRGVLSSTAERKDDHMPQKGSDFRLMSSSCSRVSFSSMFRS
ncbi:MAG: hypothetical protein MZV70_44510 [Desulfobacterales bacterium]|nr:hypothetical protein [Desulfobacterales bacterium]